VGVELVLGVARDHLSLLGRHFSSPLLSSPLLLPQRDRKFSGD
jgi:hypothetical protein